MLYILELEAMNEGGLELVNDIFHNPLIADEIWKCFNVNTLLQTSLVCKSFCSLSRKFLRISHFCSIQLNRNPCRALKIVDRLLETSTDVCYNGIRHKRKLLDDDCSENWYLPYGCDDSCLGNELEDSVDVRQLYSNLLEKMEFRFVCFRARINKNCPFLKLIEVILTDKANEILELRACGRTLMGREISADDGMDYLNITPFSSPLWFPNLKVLKIPRNINVARKLICSAPNLMKFVGLFSNSLHSFERLGMDGKEPFKTNMSIVGMEEILRLTTTVKPRLEKVRLLPIPTEEEYENVENRMHMFGQMISKYLRRLSCSISSLTLLANDASNPQFVNVKSLMLFNDWENMSFQESISSLKSVDFKRSFPYVQTVSLNHDNCVRPTTRTVYPHRQNFQGFSVTSLKIFRDFEATPIISDIFPNVRSLKLRNFTHYNLPQLLEANPVWRGLNKLTLIGSLRDLQLDGLFLYLGNLGPSSDRGSSGSKNITLPSMKLKILTISGDMCSSPCYKQENLGCYLISKETAELVATKIPGFTIQVKVHLYHQCSSIFGPDGYNFEHIQPYARIWKTCLEPHEDQTGPLLIWNFQF